MLGILPGNVFRLLSALNWYVSRPPAATAEKHFLI